MYGKGAKPSQRPRLLQAMAALSAQEGYGRVNVADICTRAGVSRATFYELFEDKDACFAALFDELCARLLGGLREAVAEAPRTEIVRLALAELIAQLRRDPDGERVLCVESLAGGPKLRAHTLRGLDRIERFVEDLLASGAQGAGGARAATATAGATRAGARTLDIPALALIGAARDILARRAPDHADDPHPEVLDELAAWMRAYAIGAGQARFSVGPQALLAREGPPRAGTDGAGAAGAGAAEAQQAGTLSSPTGAPRAGAPAAEALSSHTKAPPAEALSSPTGGPPPPAHLGGAGAGELEPLPRGRHGLPRGVVERLRRERILAACAQVMAVKGYAETTIEEIVSVARISRGVYYEHFLDKHAAFAAAQQDAAQELLQACARAYFGDWPADTSHAAGGRATTNTPNTNAPNTNAPGTNTTDMPRDWPERVWRAMRALCETIAADPALWRLRIVEPYAAGPQAILRAQELADTLAVFLIEGRLQPGARERGLPALCARACACAILATIHRQLLEGGPGTAGTGTGTGTAGTGTAGAGTGTAGLADAIAGTAELPRRVPQLTFIAIAPYTGVQRAAEVVRALGARDGTRERSAPKSEKRAAASAVAS